VITAVSVSFRRHFGLIYLASTIAVLLLPDNVHIVLFKYTFPYFQLGYLAAGSDVPARLRARSVWVLLLGGILSVVCYAMWDRGTYVYLTGMALHRGNVEHVVVRMIGGVAGSVFALAGMGYLYRKMPDGVKRAVVALGTDSIYIFIVQTYVFKSLADTFARMPFSISGSPGKFAFSVGMGLMVAGASWYLGRLVAKSRWAGLFMFGKVKKAVMLEPVPAGAVNVPGNGGLS